MRKAMWLMLACGVMLVGWMVGSAVVADVKAEATVLFDFEDDADVNKWDTNNDKTDRSLSTEHATSGKGSMKVVLKAGEFPGISTGHISLKDWSGYTTLKFDIFADSAFDLMMTVKDPNSKNYDTRYNNDKIEINKGANTISIAVGDIGDKIDLKKINLISIHAGTLDKEVTFYMDNMRLEK